MEKGCFGFTLLPRHHMAIVTETVDQERVDHGQAMLKVLTVNGMEEEQTMHLIACPHLDKTKAFFMGLECLPNYNRLAVYRF